MSPSTSSSDAGGTTPEGIDAGPVEPDVGPPAELPFPIEPPIHAPLCLELGDTVVAADAWADRRGLFLTVASATRGSRLLQFDGARWITWSREDATASPAFSRVTGVEGSAVWTWPWSDGCSLHRFDAPGVDVCVEVGATLGPSFAVADAFFDAVDRGWVAGDAGDGALTSVRLEGGSYSGSYTCLDAAAAIGLWGDPVGMFALSPTALCAGSGGRVGVRGDVPPGPYAAMWAVDRDEIGVATGDGRLLVLDGAAWSTHPSGLPELTHVARSSSALAFAARHAVGVLGAEGRPRVLASWGDDRVTVAALAAHDADVYVLLVDRSLASSACGPLIAVRFSGGEARRL